MDRFWVTSAQGVGVATGIQSKFSWNAVALAGISGAISGANGGSSKTFAEAAIKGATNNAITQGLGVALGLQKKFSWAGVAAAGVGAGVFHELGGAGASQALYAGDTSAGVVGQFIAASGASALASAATQSFRNAHNRYGLRQS